MEHNLEVSISADVSAARAALSGLAAHAKAVKADIQNTGVIGKIFQFFQGRFTFFAIVFTVLGTWLEFHGKLEANYVALMTLVQGLVLAHSIKEDYHARKCGQMVDDAPDGDK